MVIQLKNNYFIETDPLNFTLKQSYTGESKDGVKKRILKSYRTLPEHGSCPGTLFKAHAARWER